MGIRPSHRVQSSPVREPGRFSGLLGLVFFTAGLFLIPAMGWTQSISNTASGTAVGLPMDSTSSTVTLTRSPLNPADPDLSTVTVDPQVVIADGVAVSTITITLLDSSGNPIQGKDVSVESDRPLLDTLVQPPSTTDANGRATATISSTTPGLSTITATDTLHGITLNDRPVVVFTAGKVLRIHKTVHDDEAVIGDSVLYTIEIENTAAYDVNDVRILDQIPPNFKYRKGTTLLDGMLISDPAGNRTLDFNIASIGADQTLKLTYYLTVGSGAKPGVEYENRAVAREGFIVDGLSALSLQTLAVCTNCDLSNTTGTGIRIVFDPIFDLGSIIGKVFNDSNQNGYQDRGEEGIPDAMVALDDATYVITDDMGRYHFPSVRPGQRMLKINLASIPGGEMTTDESRIVSVTRGLLAKVNFGVRTDEETRKIGQEGVRGIDLVPEVKGNPILLMGNTESMTIDINGRESDLPNADIRLGVKQIIQGSGKPGESHPPFVSFELDVSRKEVVKKWKLVIFGPEGEVFHQIEEDRIPPQEVLWNGIGSEKIPIETEASYGYSLSVEYKDGSRGESSPGYFSLKPLKALSFSISDFEAESFTLSPRARAFLDEAAEFLRQHPDEKVFMEGHADASGPEDLNFKLSKQRVRAAVDYLIEVQNISPDRFEIGWYGSSKPIWDNSNKHGRALNRRIEMRGEIKPREDLDRREEDRIEPEARINGLPVPVHPDGVFKTEISDPDSDQLTMVVRNKKGGTVETTLDLPTIRFSQPKGAREFRIGEKGEDFEVFGVDTPLETEPAMRFTMKGATAPENRITVNGKAVSPDEKGAFKALLELSIGKNSIEVISTTPRGTSRIYQVVIALTDRNEDGRLFMIIDPVPFLEVTFPSAEGPLKGSRVPIRGKTISGNSVKVQEKTIPVKPDGTFSTSLSLPHGETTRVRVQVEDPGGYSGNIERDIEIAQNEIFLLAFADGEVGQMRASGFIEGSGQGKERDYYSEGRIAYYFKGVILGKYLVTSALDTGKREFNRMFDDLDRSENERLLTNLDPDKYYPVYGDSSTIVYDAESQGRFYLAVDSDELHLLIGDFPVGMNKTELAGYNRTVYGGGLTYQSLSSTRYGDPNTEVLIFGAEIRTANTQNQFLATGGSLYYLSNNDVIEGSEQVRIEVRDKDTGLILSNHPQDRDIDYHIKYDEGRLFFNRPISSVSDDLSGLIDSDPIGGNPVYIVVDFEYQAGFFEENAHGGRVRQQIGDHLSVGGSYVRDDEGLTPYELNAGDLEVRFGKGTRILGEFASSRGAGSETTFSPDGGLSFTPVTAGKDPEGRAYKASLETDVGELFGNPGQYRLKAYLKDIEAGYSSNGTILEQGTRKAGLGATFRMSRFDTLHLRYEGQRILDNGNFLSQVQVGGRSSYTETVQWTRNKGKLTMTGEFQAKELNSGGEDIRSQTTAIRADYRLTNNLLVYSGQQLTLGGPVQNKTMGGSEYRIGRYRAFGEASTGTLGEGLRAGLSREVGSSGIISISHDIRNDSEVGRSSQSIFHAENRIGQGTRVYTEYQMNQTETADSNASVAGVNQRWGISEALSINLLGEIGRRVQEGETIIRQTAGAGLQMQRLERFRFSDYFELRYERGNERKLQVLTRNHAELWLGRDFRLLAGVNASLTQNRSIENTEARSSELSAGLAYRPVHHDRLNGILKYTLIKDQRPLQNAFDIEEETQMSVWSAMGSLDLSRYLEWVEKVAFKIKEDRIGTGDTVETHTTLWVHRLNVHIIHKWDLGIEYRTLSIRELRDRQDGFLLEVTREFAKHLRLGAGYNFTHFSDNEFSDNNFSVHGWFFRFQGKY